MRTDREIKDSCRVGSGTTTTYESTATLHAILEVLLDLRNLAQKMTYFSTQSLVAIQAAVWEEAATIAEAHRNKYDGAHDCYDGNCQDEIVRALLLRAKALRRGTGGTT